MRVADRVRVASILFIVAVAGCGGSSPPSGTASGGPGAGGRAMWTVLVYMGGDNNLERFVLQDLEEMERVGSSGAVNVVVQVDTETIPVHGTVEAQRLRIEPAPAAGVQSPALQTLGEIDMSDWRELADFVDWGIASFPAVHYALVLWDHGAEWLGVINDLSGSGALMSAFELDLAFQTIQNRTGIARFDLVGFDACLMAGIEIDAMLVPYARARVASEENEPGAGWAYDAWLRALERRPTMTGFELGREIAASYLASLAGGFDERISTASVVALDAVPALETAIDALATTLLPLVPARILAELAPARRFATEWGKRSPHDPAVSVDLLGLVEGVRARTADPAVRAACDGVIAALGAAVTFRANGAQRAAAGGIAIYFPASASATDPRYFTTVFGLTNAWTQLVVEYHRAILADTTPPAVQIVRVTPQPPAASPLQSLRVDLGAPPPDLYMQTAGVYLPVGPGLVEVGTFDVTGATSLFWDGSLFILTDGVEENWLPLRPIAPGFPYSIAFAEWNASLIVTLVVFIDPITGAPALVRAFYSPDGLRFGELPLSVGDALAVRLPYYDAAAGQWFDVSSPVPVFVGPGFRIDTTVIPGTYDVVIVAEDHAENFGFAIVPGVSVP